MGHRNVYFFLYFFTRTNKKKKKIKNYQSLLVKTIHGNGQ